MLLLTLRRALKGTSALNSFWEKFGMKNKFIAFESANHFCFFLFAFNFQVVLKIGWLYFGFFSIGPER